MSAQASKRWAHRVVLSISTVSLLGAPGCRASSGEFKLMALSSDNPYCREVTLDGRRKEATELILNGRIYLDRAIQREQRHLFVAAGQCFRNALVARPNNYDAHLHLGVTHLSLAKYYRSPRLWKKDIVMAKRYLTQAHAIRRGESEPLYYLAEISVLERKNKEAKALLRILVEGGALPGPTHALLGFLYERENDLDSALYHYEQAVLAGFPSSTITYTLDRGMNRSAKK